MKNIQVIDDALNCTYDVFEVSDIDFEVVFPNSGQNIEFSEDLVKRTGEDNTLFDRIWKHRLLKSEIKGIHGTLFYGLEFKKQFYPTKRESEMTNGL